MTLYRGEDGFFYDGTRRYKDFIETINKITFYEKNAVIYDAILNNSFLDYYFAFKSLGFEYTDDLTIKSRDKSFSYIVSIGGDTLSFLVKIEKGNWLKIYNANLMFDNLQGRDFLQAVNALKQLGGKGGTLASYSLSIFKGMTKNYEFIFCQDKYSDFVRSSYRGGFNYINPRYQDKEIGEMWIYDVNSLYPYIFAFYPMPYGYGKHGDGTPTEDIREKARKKEIIYFIRFLCSFSIKEGHIPFVCPSVAGKYSKNKICETTAGENVIMTMTNTEFSFFQEQYNVYNLVILDYVYYMAKIGVGRPYVEKFYKLKENAEGAEREAYKGMLNYLTGNFAKKTDRKNLKYNEKKKSWEIIERQIKEKVAVQVGCAITSYARVRTVWHAQLNYENWVYSDTDSIHLLKPATGIIKDEKKIGCYKLDKVDGGYYHKLKWYGSRIGDKPKLTLAGVPTDICESIEEEYTGDTLESIFERLEGVR